MRCIQQDERREKKSEKKRIMKRATESEWNTAGTKWKKGERIGKKRLKTH